MAETAELEAPTVEQEQTEQAPQQPPASKAEMLYNKLLKEGYTEKNLGDKFTFIKNSQDPIKANKLYSVLRSDGYTEQNLGDMVTFRNNLLEKKSPGGNGSANGSPQSESGSSASQNTNRPRKDAAEWKQLFDQSKANQEKYGVNEDPIKAWEKQQLAKGKKEQADYDKLPLSEKVKSVSNNLVAGAADMAKGSVRAASGIEQWIFNPDDPKGKEIRQNIADAAKDINNNYIDKGTDAASFKIPKKDQELMDKHGLTGAVNGFANFLPAIATAERTGGASFFFNDYEKGYEQIDKLDPKLSEGQKQLYATLRGTASALLMSHGLSSAISAGGEKAEQAVIDDVSKKAIADLSESGEDLTPEAVKSALTKNITTRALEYAEKSVKGAPKSVATMTGLEGINIGIEKLINTTSGKKVFNQDDIPQRLENAFVNGLGLHLAGSLIGATSLLSKSSEQRNDVAESLYHDPSDENVANIKVGLTDHLKEQGFSDEYVAQAHNVVDQLHEVVKDMPKGANPEQIVPAIEKKLADRQLFEQQKAAMNDQITHIDDAIQTNEQRPAVTPAEIADKEVVTEKLTKEREGLNNELKKTISKQYEDRSKPVEEVPAETPKEDAAASKGQPDKTVDEGTKNNIKDLAGRIAKGEKVTSTEDLQLQGNHPKELEQELKNLKNIDEKSGDPVKPKKQRPKQKSEYAKRANKVLDNEPRSLREAILHYFVGGGKISSEDFRRFTGFSPGKDGKPFISFLKKANKENRDEGGLPLDYIGENHIPEQFTKGEDVSNEIINTMQEFKGSRNAILKELERLQGAGEQGQNEEELHKYGQLTDDERETVDKIRSGELTDDEANAIINKSDALDKADDHINERKLTEHHINELSGLLDKYTDEKGNTNWDAIEKEFDDFGYGDLIDVSNIKENEKPTAKTEPEQSSKSAPGLKDDSGEKNSKIEVKLTDSQQKISDDYDKKIGDAKDKVVASRKRIESKLNEVSKKNNLFGNETVGKTKGQVNAFDVPLDVSDENMKSSVMKPLIEEYTAAQKSVDDLQKEKEHAIKNDTKQQKIEVGANHFALEKERETINNKLAESEESGATYVPYSEKVKLQARLDEIEDKLNPKKVVAGAAVMPLPFTKEFIEHDVKPIIQSIASNTKEAFERIAKAIRPQIGVSMRDEDTITKNINARNEEAAKIDKLVNAYEKMFDKMKDPERIDFIDRIKRGLPQPTPELQQIADEYKKWDKDLYDAISDIKGSLPFKEDHFRVLWKTIPGTEKTRSWFGRAKRPLEGSKGFLKKATLIDMSEGIAKGGEPVSTNPMTLFKLAHADATRFITAHRMFDALKTDGVVKFVKTGKEVPEGFTRINDKIANVYFPVKEGMVKAGEWYIEKNAGRMVNNLLSEDKLRNTPIGKGILALKNFYTGIELSLSPFHATVMSLEAVSSDVGKGLRKLTGGDITGGIKDVLKAPFSPKTTFSLGRKYINLASQNDFENSPIGKEFLANNPLAKEYLHDFFMGGGLTHQDNAYKLQAYQGLKDQLAKDNYIGAGLRLLPALNETLMSPLFDTYIPGLKVGMFMKEFPLTLKENADRLASGKVTREALARKTSDFIDDRLGEMNFDNLYWDRTFKTATQLFFRSVTWKLGNARALGGAIPEQGMEFYNAYKEGRHPVLQPKMAWLFGLAVTHAAISSLVQYGFTGTLPQNFKDLMWPRLSNDDNKERAVIPDYTRDITSIGYQGFSKYIQNSMAGDNTKILDVWNNSDFQKYEIVDPKDPLYKQGEDALKYMLPQPIGFSQVGKDVKAGTPLPKAITHFIGFSPAPKYITNTPIENKIFDLYNVQEGIKTKGQKEKSDLKDKIRDLYKNSKEKEADKLIDQSIDNGDLSVKEIKYLLPSNKSGESPAVYLFNGLKDDNDKVWLYNQMTEAEKEQYDPKGKIAALAEKKANAEKDKKPYSILNN